MARRLDHRRGQQQLGEHLQRLHQQEGQGETTSVDTPAGQVADRGRRRIRTPTVPVCILRFSDMHIIWVPSLD